MRALRAVALDLSPKATAIGSTHDSRGEPFLSVFTIPGTAGRPLHEQIAAIETVIRRQCGGAGAVYTYRPDVVIIEGTFSRDNGHASDYPLHALHANVKQWLWRRSIPYVDVSPGTLKIWATGRGDMRGPAKVTKRDVVAGIIAAYGNHLLINPADDNQADAVGLLSMVCAQYGQPIAEIPHLPGKANSHRRALKNVTGWPVLDLSGLAFVSPADGWPAVGVTPTREQHQ